MIAAFETASPQTSKAGGDGKHAPRTIAPASANHLICSALLAVASAGTGRQRRRPSRRCARSRPGRRRARVSASSARLARRSGFVELADSPRAVPGSKPCVTKPPRDARRSRAPGDRPPARREQVAVREQQREQRAGSQDERDPGRGSRPGRVLAGASDPPLAPSPVVGVSRRRAADEARGSPPRSSQPIALRGLPGRDRAPTPAKTTRDQRQMTR